MENDDEIIIIDSDDEQWAASFAPKPKLNGFEVGIADGVIEDGRNPREEMAPSIRAETEKYDEDDDEIEIVEEKMAVRRTPTPVQPIQLTAEAQKKILLEASKTFMRDIRPKGKITGCSIVVGNKKAAEAEAKLRMEKRKKEKDTVAPDSSLKRKFGTELGSSKKRKQSNKESKASLSDGSKRSSSDQENTTPSQSEVLNGLMGGSGSEAMTENKSFNGSFVSYIRRFAEGHQNRGPVAKKTASVIEPAWGPALSSMKTQYTEFLAKEVCLKYRNGICYISSGLFSKVYSNFYLEMDILQKKLKEHICIGDVKRSTSEEEHHFIYSGWIISYISLHAAIAIVNAMGKKPAVLHKCLTDLNSASKNKVVLIDDLSVTEGKKKGLPGTQLSDLSEEEFGDIFGLCTHEKAEKILRAKRENMEVQKGGRKMKLRAKLQEGSDPVSHAQKKRGPCPPKANLAKICTGRVKPFFRTTRGSQGGSNKAAAPSAGKIKDKDSSKDAREVSCTPLKDRTPEIPRQKTLPQRRFDAPPFDPISGKIVHNPPDVVHLCRTPLLDKKGIRFPDGWFVRGKLKPDKTRYHFYYHSPDGKRFKNYQEAINYCLENGNSMSDLISSLLPSHQNVPKKRKNTPSSNQGASPSSDCAGARTTNEKNARSHTKLDTNNAIMSQGKIESKVAKSQTEQGKTAHTGNNTARERFRHIAARKFPINVCQPTSSSSPSTSTNGTYDDCSPAVPVSDKSMISKKRKRSPQNSHPDLMDRLTMADTAPVHFNLATFRPLPFRSVDGWFSAKVSGLRRIVHEAEKEAGVGKKVNIGYGGMTLAPPLPTTPNPRACTASPSSVASESSAESPPPSKPESERRGANGGKTLHVTYSEGHSAMTDLHEWRHARARAMQYSSAAEKKASAAAAARARKEEIVAKKIAECSSVAAGTAKRRGAHAIEEELCLPPGCYKRRTSRSMPVKGTNGEGEGVLYCNANGKTFDSISKLWAAETADREGPEA